MRSSIFRIRSRTAPLGLMKEPDIEKIRTEILPEDYVIMFSDGATQDMDDSPVLPEILAKEPKRNLSEYARAILSALPKSKGRCDDTTVSVVKITRTIPQ